MFQINFESEILMLYYLYSLDDVLIKYRNFYLISHLTQSENNLEYVNFSEHSKLEFFIQKVTWKKKIFLFACEINAKLKPNKCR